MEALAAAYDSSTDDEEYRPDGEGKEEEREQRRQSEQREGKRRRMVDFGFDSKTQYHFPETVSAAAGRFATSRSNSVEEGSIQQVKSAVPVWPSGRYVPKRERAAAAAALADSTLSQSSSSVIRSPGSFFFAFHQAPLNSVVINIVHSTPLSETFVGSRNYAKSAATLTETISLSSFTCALSCD